MPTSSIQKVEICWAEDASGRTTCHLNVNHKTLEETYVGEIVFKEGKWYSKLKDDPKLHGPHKMYRVAQKHVEASVNGVLVGEDWT